MRARNCALGADLWGIVLLIGAYLQLYGDSRCGELCLHPAFTGNEAPYILAFGLPIVLSVMGGVGDSMHRALWLRLVLWLGAVALAVAALLAFASLGPFLYPSAILGAMSALSSRLEGGARQTV